jgi:hypothetical protein
MAFQQADGKVAWSQNNYGNVYSSPILINVDGLEQLAVVLDGTVIGVNPHNGDLAVGGPVQGRLPIAVAMPGGARTTCCSCHPEYNAGSKGIELKRNGMQTTATELCEPRFGFGCITATPCESATRSFLERRKGEPGDPERRGCTQRQDPAGAHHRKSQPFVWRIRS